MDTLFRHGATTPTLLNRRLQTFGATHRAVDDVLLPKAADDHTVRWRAVATYRAHAGAYSLRRGSTRTHLAHARSGALPSLYFAKTGYLCAAAHTPSGLTGCRRDWGVPATRGHVVRSSRSLGVRAGRHVRGWTNLYSSWVGHRSSFSPPDRQLCGASRYTAHHTALRTPYYHTTAYRTRAAAGYTTFHPIHHLCWHWV